jgi:hypothetical protein
MDPFDTYGDALRRALHAEADAVVPAPDGLDRIRACLNALATPLDRAVYRLLPLVARLRLLIILLAAITNPRREAAMPYTRRPLELHRGDVIVARPPNPDHPEHDGEPGHWRVTEVERVWDRVAIDATGDDGADWRFVPKLTDPIEIGTPRTKETMR